MTHVQQPLSPTTLAILLALADGAQHGYGIMKAVEADPGGPRLGAGTLYAALQRLTQEGLIEEVGTQATAGEDRRRRYYMRTGAGEVAARGELQRLLRVVRATESRRLLGGAPLPRLAEEG
jgi:DNA-binding PadR family transcriptional regulator